jgi:hypothetical protein
MSNPTTPFSWQMPTATDLVTDLPADFEVFGQAVATSMADLLGGTTGQILAKNSATDMDFVWIANDQGDITGVTAGTGISGGGTSGTVTVTNSMATAIDAKGDLIAGTGADAFSRLAIGTNNQVLTADSTAATGMKWATPAGGGGKVLQVVMGTTATSKTISTSTLTDSNLTASITPTSATSKVLVLLSQQIYNSRTGSDAFCQGAILRGATQILYNSYVGGEGRAGASTLLEFMHTWSPVYLDSPATTSATTYKTQLCTNSSGTVEAQAFSSNTSTMILLEIGA